MAGGRQLCTNQIAKRTPIPTRMPGDALHELQWCENFVLLYLEPTGAMATYFPLEAAFAALSSFSFCSCSAVFFCRKPPPPRRDVLSAIWSRS